MPSQHMLPMYTPWAGYAQPFSSPPFQWPWFETFQNKANYNQPQPNLESSTEKIYCWNLSTLTNLKKPAEISNSKMDSYLKLGISDNHKPSPKGMESRMEGLAPSSVRKADGENMKVVCSNLNSFSTHSKLTEINNVFTKENQSVSPDKHEKPKTCKVGKKKVEGTKLKLLV